MPYYVIKVYGMGFEKISYKLQNMKKNVFNFIVTGLMIVFVFSGCMEPGYYRIHHQHSPHYEQRHHRMSHHG
jgi:hypothetical protein